MAAYLDNPLLFPTFHDTIITIFEKVKDGTIPLRAWASLKVLFMGYGAGIVLAASLHYFGDLDPDRHGFS